LSRLLSHHPRFVDVTAITCTYLFMAFEENIYIKYNITVRLLYYIKYEPIYKNEQCALSKGVGRNPRKVFALILRDFILKLGVHISIIGTIKSVMRGPTRRYWNIIIVHNIPRKIWSLVYLKYCITIRLMVRQKSLCRRAVKFMESVLTKFPKPLFTSTISRCCTQISVILLKPS